MNVGVNYMREHMPSDARVHYAMLDAGGIAPNVVQARAKVRYSIRAMDLAGMQALVARVRKIAEGAALMTETKVDVRIISAVSNLLGNAPLERAMADALEQLGPPAFDDADVAFAKAIQATLSDDDLDIVYRAVGLPRSDAALGTVVPLDSPRRPQIGSTDVGDVSWAVPTVQAHGAVMAIGTPFHSWQLVAQGKAPAAHKGMVQVAKAMASLACEALTNHALIAAAKADHAARIGRAPYRCPIPDDVAPPIHMSSG
jgi:aminobenzoyl-glutamate utilization protein B